MARNLIGEEGMANLRVASQKRSYKKKKKQRTYTVEDALAFGKYMIKKKHAWGSVSKASRKFGFPSVTLNGWNLFLFRGKLGEIYKKHGVPAYLQEARRQLRQPKTPKEPKADAVVATVSQVAIALRKLEDVIREEVNAEWEKKLKGLIK